MPGVRGQGEDRRGGFRCGGWATGLLDNELADEMNLLIVSVVVGQGTRRCPGTGLDRARDMVDSRAVPTGVMLQVYWPTGRPRTQWQRPVL